MKRRPPSRVVPAIVALLAVIAACLWYFWPEKKGDPNDARILSYVVSDKEAELVRMHWKDEHGQAFRSLENLKNWTEKDGRTLHFAMNGGMFKPDHSPLGLYIQNSIELAPLNTSNGSGNFFLKPNGVFYLTSDQRGHVSTTEAFQMRGAADVVHATQSGPMLLIDGKINSQFTQGSTNLNIRNGVGVQPNGQIVFALSKVEVNFHDFAAFFQRHGCQNALYLDGVVSRAYAPDRNWTQTDGDFTVIISVTRPALVQ